jgi:hypothetical protein
LAIKIANTDEGSGSYNPCPIEETLMSVPLEGSLASNSIGKKRKQDSAKMKFGCIGGACISILVVKDKSLKIRKMLAPGIGSSPMNL